MTDSQKAAAHSHKQACAKGKFFRSQNACDDKVFAGSQLSVRLQRNATAKFIKKQCRMCFCKPYFPRHEELHFNLSHSGALALCALDAAPVGVDIQVIKPLRPALPRRVCSPREALLAPQETLPLEQCRGRVLAAPTVSCPPAVPILICGEEISEDAIRCFRYYGMDRCTVVRPL